ncbi:MAG TPA: hypothetical protein VKU02_24995 [Gemmataceae bacterium]|nr:hypothetical protein [Gemmataceae bacterium]
MAPPDPRRPPETAKQRAVRIPLNYFKQADALTRWKLGLTVLALVLALGWWAIGFGMSDEGRLRYSRGPVAAAHATWEANCESCHVPFAPINGTHWSTALVGNLQESKSRCEQCHAGPVHHASQKQSDTPTCGGCHHDHQGRDASLVHLPDSDCTNCHANLAAHMDGKPQYEAAVTRFEKGHHPAIHVDKDPGKLKFNHQMHLANGMAGAKWKLGDIRDPQERERYRQQQPAGQKDDAALVQLTCTSCHVLDRADLATKSMAVTSLPARAAGDLMLPIRYENHCRACHPLTFDPKSPDLTIPHGLQPRQVHDFLWGAYAEEELGKQERDLPKPMRRPLPGMNATEAPPGMRKEIDAKLAGKMEAFLYRDKVEDADRKVFLGKQTCGECHVSERSGAQIVPNRIVPPQVPEVWFKHAVFDHAAHRALDCLACHAQAKTSAVSADVLLPNMDTCLQCHSPQTRRDGKIQGGARFDCTECHRYHHGENPLQGIGTVKRGVTVKRNIEEFLQGRP